MPESQYYRNKAKDENPSDGRVVINPSQMQVGVPVPFVFRRIRYEAIKRKDGTLDFNEVRGCYELS